MIATAHISIFLVGKAADQPGHDLISPILSDGHGVRPFVWLSWVVKVSPVSKPTPGLDVAVCIITLKRPHGLARLLDSLRMPVMGEMPIPIAYDTLNNLRKIPLMMPM
ncbi:MAG: hypothetical protein ACNA70_09675 [Brevefilum sp.]